MNRTELLQEVKSWLQAGNISFAADDEEVIHLRINADNGLLDVRLSCEDEPTLLQACCPVPVRMPKEKISETSLLLHNLNTRLRMGAFHFHVEERVIEFRLPMPIRPDSGLAEQFSQTVGMATSTLDELLPALCLLASSTAEALKVLSRFAPRDSEPDPASCRASNRLQLN